jgi:hypothetical protein
MQSHWHEILETGFSSFATWGTSGNNASAGNTTGSGSSLDRQFQARNIISGNNGTPRITRETRPASISSFLCIKY